MRYRILHVAILGLSSSPVTLHQTSGQVLPHLSRIRSTMFCQFGTDSPKNHGGQNCPYLLFDKNGVWLPNLLSATLATRMVSRYRIRDAIASQNHKQY